MSEQQKQVKAALKATVGRIKELKAIKRANKQWSAAEPGWVNGPFGLELEQQRHLATVLCAARAMARKRVHAVRFPRALYLPPCAGSRWGAHVKDADGFAAFVQAEVAIRFPVAAPAEQPVEASRTAA
jgi:hypothetical protein